MTSDLACASRKQDLDRQGRVRVAFGLYNCKLNWLAYIPNSSISVRSANSQEANNEPRIRCGPSSYSSGGYLQRKNEIGPGKGKVNVQSLFCIQTATEFCDCALHTSRHMLDAPRSVLVVQHVVLQL